MAIFHHNINLFIFEGGQYLIVAPTSANWLVRWGIWAGMNASFAMDTNMKSFRKKRTGWPVETVIVGI